MENIINWVILIASFLTAITTICMFCKKAISKGFEPIYGRIDKIDENQCRNYLVDFLADIKAGVKKDECQIERAYELYDHYTKDLGGNSYIHSKWGKIMKERKVD